MDSISPSEVLRRIVTALGRAGIAYMLTGSLASSFHGVPRSTQDIDIVIEANSEQLQKFMRSLPEAEYYADLDAPLEAYRRGSLFNVIDVTKGWRTLRHYCNCEAKHWTGAIGRNGSHSWT